MLEDSWMAHVDKTFAGKTSGKDVKRPKVVEVAHPLASSPSYLTSREGLPHRRVMPMRGVNEATQ